jgi:hypothetical protein
MDEAGPVFGDLGQCVRRERNEAVQRVARWILVERELQLLALPLPAAMGHPVGPRDEQRAAVRRPRRVRLSREDLLATDAVGDGTASERVKHHLLITATQ